MAKIKLPKIEDLFEAGVHFGHQVRRWHPSMEKFIFSHRKGVHIIDLEKTHERLEEGTQILHDVAAEGGQIIFVGTKRQAKEIVKLEAERCGAMFVNERWLGGTITNYHVIRRNIDKLLDYLRKREAGEFDVYTKKERLLLDRAIDKLTKSVGGITNLQGAPAALFVVDGRREKTAIREANRVGLPVVAVVDTNTNISEIPYVIPGNDDAIRSIAMLVKVVADAVEAGYSDYAKKVKKTADDKEAEAKKAAEEKAKEVEAKKTEAPKVTGSEASHTSKKAGKKHVKKVAKGEEEVKVGKDKKEKKDSK
jgi:small subunit ribosomal protein S2